jgi:hypothetical protein
MPNTLNPLPIHTFTTPSALRALPANGFRMLFCTMLDGHLAALAQMMDDVPSDPPRMSDDERNRRTRLYRIASDLAVLQIPEALRGRVADEWDGAVERSLANRTAEILKGGRIKVQAPKEAKRA